ncbi:hypothetical protein WKR88_13455 [Trinickia caryophylli]|uniref:Lipoprotein n=1 Tax=Trinickia caryophylli TaxID=28094 RepID=A0A1X7ELR8_TRICW|nr:hypothetical protein [Trinickia caryophylli]WQE10427.1 hypothetical protein U0034_11455 [Trinickia caryophylli]SMF36138.1 hypothetical protein SAMN06295900_10627 [Trinickia caryophylli]
MRRLIATFVMLGGLACLPGCATSTQTFALGGLLGFMAGVGAVSCTAMCQ